MDKKPTDTEIKKALYDYKNSNLIQVGNGKVISISDIIDLINRLQAEKEELQELVNEMSDYFPACIGCEGKTEDGVRTDKCVFLIDKTNYCVKRGISNIVAIRKENAELKAENERLTTLAELGNMRANDYRVMRDRALKAEAENERLSREYFTYKIRWAKATARLDTAKAEAYKECIEKVKDLFPKEDWFTREAFDNLLKELVGDNNAKEKE